MPKRRRISLLMIKISGVILWCGVMALYYGITKKIAAVTVVSIAVSLSALTILLLSCALASTPDRAVKMRWLMYYMTQPEEKLDYAAEIASIRENYKKDPDPQKNRIAKPNFAGAKPFCDYSVLDHGEIRYAAVVEANSDIFDFSHKIHKVYPIVVVYGTDGYFDSAPEELQKIAAKLYEDRHNNFLKNERHYFSNVRLSDELTGGREVYATVIMAYRYHLPFGVIERIHAVVPIIAAPGKSRSAFIADSKYWSTAFAADYLHIEREKEIDPFDYSEEDENSEEESEAGAEENPSENTEVFLSDNSDS